MAAGKWITGINPADRLADAAHHILSARLDNVRHYLGLALFEASKDREYVHHLRVGTRRAGASLAIFDQCLPRKAYRRANRFLRTMRRAAGAARDWDVFLLSLDTHGSSGQRRHASLVDLIRGWALNERAQAQVQLLESSPDHPSAMNRLLKSTLKAIGEPGKGRPATVGEVALPVLTEAIRRLEEAAHADQTDFQQLHQVRIESKKLRYAMEVFASCFNESFQNVLYPLVEEMQECLGRANDCYTASQHLTALRGDIDVFIPEQKGRYQTGLEQFQKQLHETMAREVAAFPSIWQRWLSVGGITGLEHSCESQIQRGDVVSMAGNDNSGVVGAVGAARELMGNTGAGPAAGTGAERGGGGTAPVNGLPGTGAG